MRLPTTLRVRLWDALMTHVVARRPADFVIGVGYLYRWWVLPRNRAFNIYLHCIERDDDDRALHDHPWINVSILLQGSYWEHVPGGVAIERTPGSVVFRKPGALHRLSMGDGCLCVWSLFLTGPTVRTWGFQCPNGWRPWYEFVDTDDPGQPGRGCD